MSLVQEKIKKYEYEKIDGKPYFGIYQGKALSFNENYFEEVGLEGIKKMMEKSIEYLKEKGFKIRHAQWICNEPNNFDPLIQNTTVALKFLTWGRAFKICKFFKIGKKVYKKKRVSGRLKRVRVNYERTNNQTA